MKLIFCLACRDIVRLHLADAFRYCQCGRSFGRYRTERIAEVGGACRVLGVHSVGFLKAASAVGGASTCELHFINEPSDGVRRVQAPG